MNYYNYAPNRKKWNFLNLIGMLSSNFWIIFLSIVLSLGGFIVFNFFPDYTSFIALKPSNILEGKYIWTLISHMFFHGGLFHLFVNMFVLFSLGSLCERIIGRKRYLFVYLSSGIFAGLISVIASGFLSGPFWNRIVGSPELYMVGASGAIFAIAGLYFVLLPHLRFSIVFIPFFSLPAKIMIPVVLFITWIVSFFADLPVGNVAHLGGFIFGVGYGFYLAKKYPQKLMKLRRMIR